jgi:hypothetical protein
MKVHGWHTTEVFSSPYHLPRTALILRHYPQLQWETHPGTMAGGIWAVEETTIGLERGGRQHSASGCSAFDDRNIYRTSPHSSLH